MYNVYTYKSNWWGFIGKRVLIAVVVFFLFTFAVSLTISSTMYSSPFYFTVDGEQIFYPLPLNVTVDDEHMLIYYYPDRFYPDISNVQIYVHWLGDFFTGDWGYSLYPESFYSK
jgi:hypothetical protein